MTDDIIFTSVTGSRLYGLDHEGSDKDSIIVYGDKRKTRHKIVGEDDTIHVGLAELLDKAFSGSPQFVEAVFSHRKEWQNTDWRPMFDSFRVPVSAVRAKYMRTIRAFIGTDTQKSRQHAVRLGVALRDLRRNNGWYSPTLNQENRELVQTMAHNYQGEELLQKIEEIIYE